MNNSVTTTVLASAASTNLTVLATVRDELSLATADTSKDAFITRAIGQVSKAISNYANRTFAPEYVQDYITIQRMRSQCPGGASVVQLSRWPVLAMVSLLQSSATLGTTTALIEGTDFRADYDTGLLYRTDASIGTDIGWEPWALTVKYLAGFGAAVKESRVIPASPYQLTVNAAATFSCDGVVAYASGTALTAVASSPTVGQYSVNKLTGTYTFAAADTGKTITITYATLDVPDDVEQAALLLLTERVSSRGRDSRLMQRETPGVGSERWWVGGAPGEKGGFPPEVTALLDNYHVPVIA